MFDNTVKRIRQSLTLKLIAIGILLVIFLIPSFMVRGLIEERSYRQNSTIDEVAGKWGRAQTITGPVLVVPYMSRVIGENNVLFEEKQEAYFLPDTLVFSGNAETQVRSRGIYDVTVYEGTVNLSGEFTHPAIENLHLGSDSMLWGEAYVALGVSDLRGVQNRLNIQWNGKPIEFLPGAKARIIGSGVHALVPTPATGAPIPFEVALTVRGTDTLLFAPLGKETNGTFHSSWPHPSFVGAFLPKEHTITANGFDASWHVLNLNRNLPQEWTSDDQQYSLLNNGSVGKEDYYRMQESAPPIMSPTSDDAFGVRFFIPVDVYQKTTRSAKYAMAVIAMIFVSVFFIEIKSKTKIHPVQYVLIGLALVVYYTLLLSLSEYIGFVYAYLAASVSVIGLITLFVKSILHDMRLSLTTSGILALFYGFTYTLIQLEDYALLLGSIALFVILGVIMYISRRINWYGGNEA